MSSLSPKCVHWIESRVKTRTEPKEVSCWGSKRNSYQNRQERACEARKDTLQAFTSQHTSSLALCRVPRAQAPHSRGAAWLCWDWTCSRSCPHPHGYNSRLLAPVGTAFIHKMRPHWGKPQAPVLPEHRSATSPGQTFTSTAALTWEAWSLHLDNDVRASCMRGAVTVLKLLPDFGFNP